jgi:hypothetical protein
MLNISRTVVISPKKLGIESIDKLKFLFIESLIKIAILKDLNNCGFLLALSNKPIKLIEKVHLTGGKLLNQLQINNNLLLDHLILRLGHTRKFLLPDLLHFILPKQFLFYCGWNEWDEGVHLKTLFERVD